ncbi:hypothetical protein GCM10023350_36580 [Nocardioides endophyticus]|uniref:Uncharacterized protein n=1 Tax=Nocardioides endophyticus TaxID=1353775 RepID=A0ABP8Z6R7_9ACTN
MPGSESKQARIRAAGCQTNGHTAPTTRGGRGIVSVGAFAAAGGLGSDLAASSEGSLGTYDAVTDE